MILSIYLTHLIQLVIRIQTYLNSELMRVNLKASLGYIDVTLEQ